MDGRDNAETVALQALAWLAGQEELLGAFLGATGASLADLAAGARDPAFLGGVLDFLLQDDARILAFCDAAGLPPTAPLAARAGLPGGAQMHWT
jgi:hypothetical protein